jgi:hypothetical protein
MKLLAVPIGLREANDFVESFHRHSKRTSRDGGKWAIGVSNGNQLWGVAIVGRPLSRVIGEDTTTAEVLRVCTSAGAPKGCNFFLYGCCWRAWRAMGGRKLITYTLQSESGASLRGAGWRTVAELDPRRWDNRKDHLRRQWQPVYGQAKLRWEIQESGLG